MIIYEVLGLYSARAPRFSNGVWVLCSMNSSYPTLCRSIIPIGPRPLNTHYICVLDTRRRSYIQSAPHGDTSRASQTGLEFPGSREWPLTGLSTPNTSPRLDNLWSVYIYEFSVICASCVYCGYLLVSFTRLLFSIHTFTYIESASKFPRWCNHSRARISPWKYWYVFWSWLFSSSIKITRIIQSFWFLLYWLQI